MVKVLQIVGYKKSGKTTVVNHLIKTARIMDLTVAVVKHHGDHSGQEIDIPQKRDHLSFMESGAEESIVQGYGYIHKLKVNHQETLEAILDNEVTSNPDIIIVEGFKQADYKKLVMLRDDDDQSLLQLTHIEYRFYTDDIDTIDYHSIIKQLHNS